MAGLLSLTLVVSACSVASAEDADSANTAASNTEVAAMASDGLFDSSLVHDVTVSFDQGDSVAMIEAYTSTESKEWIKATVTIDGSTYENVGIRLKGNSSLFGLAEDGQGPTQAGNTDADVPEELPWLIRLDKYVEDQNHESISDLVVRSNNTETALNEAGGPGGALPQPPEGVDAAGGHGGHGGHGGPGSTPQEGNILAERFLADSTNRALYQQQVDELTKSLYESGAGSEVLADWVMLLDEQASDLINAVTVTTEAADIASYLDSPS